jgi:hypothetical protein
MYDDRSGKNNEMKGKQVNAILSDYDGTLCPTT